MCEVCVRHTALIRSVTRTWLLLWHHSLGKSLLSSLLAVSLKFAVRNYFIMCSFPYSFVLKLAAPRMNLVLWLYSVNTSWLLWKCEAWHFMFSGEYLHVTCTFLSCLKALGMHLIYGTLERRVPKREEGITNGPQISKLPISQCSFRPWENNVVKSVLRVQIPTWTYFL